MTLLRPANQCTEDKAMQYDFSLPRFDAFYISGTAPFYLQELLLVFRAIEAALIGMSDSNVIDTYSYITQYRPVLSALFSLVTKLTNTWFVTTSIPKYKQYPYHTLLTTMYRDSLKAHDAAILAISNRHLSTFIDTINKHSHVFDPDYLDITLNKIQSKYNVC